MSETKPFQKKVVPKIGLTRIYYDTKNAIASMEVLKETSDGTVICWDELGEMPVPQKNSDYKKLYFATEAEAAAGAIERMQKYIKECEAEIELFKKLI